MKKHMNKVVVIIATIAILLSGSTLVVIQKTRADFEQRITEKNIEIEDVNKDMKDLRAENERLQQEVNELKYLKRKWTASLNATVRLETGNKSSYRYVNNFNHGGIKFCENVDASGYCIYDSLEQGRDHFESLMYNKYYLKYGFDFKSMREEYCQCGPEDYPKFMEIYYEELEKLDE